MKLSDKLFFKTIALTALVFGAFGAILIQFSFHLQFGRERAAFEERSAYLAQSVEAAAVNYALQSIPLTDELLSALLDGMDDSASLLDGYGAVIAGSETPERTEAGIYLSDRRLLGLRPVLLSGRTYLLLTSADLSALYQARNSLLLAYSALYGLIMLLTAAVQRLAARSLTQPIERLAHISERLAAGETEVRAEPDETLEITQLAAAFNQMADSLTGQIDRQQRFIADLTHEMKTPLTAIIGHADLIRSQRVSGDSILLAAHSILKEGRRLNALSARLIDLILLKQDQINLALLRVRSLVEEAAEALQPSAHERGVQLSCHCPDVIISCDPPLFSSLLSNLIDNALKSGAKSVLVEGALNGGIFSLCVIDDGRGIERESLGKITDPFFRVDKSRSRAQDGAGLGLALCAQIARLHRASLSFESEPGKGTRVALSLCGKEAACDEQA